MLFIGPKASVQFGGDRAIVFRVIRVDQRPTYEGFVWLVGFELSPAGEAFARREIFVMVDGLLDWESLRQAAALRRLDEERAAAAGVARRAGRARNARLPGGSGPSAVRRIPVQR